MTLQTRAQQISAHVDGGQAVGLACSDPVAMTPIGVSGKFPQLFTSISHEIIEQLKSFVGLLLIIIEFTGVYILSAFLKYF